ncbi:glycosyltransferase family 4 protein [Treponema pectinovorum]|uniref:glycosyltransferase family 4 protein n=1 Tax=Treponema pectinovorum TaxID=164 RepID=UPI0011C7BC05|nr:glycosyltransferase family 1 protein [Treponema pectinovorum]
MIVINGSFLCRSLTGIERFAFEICKNLDNIVSKDEIAIFIPKNAKAKIEYKNIRCIYSKKNCKSFPIWDHITFPIFLKKNGCIPLDFANVTPLFAPGLVFIHDIYAKVFPEDFNSFKEKLIKIYMCLMYNHAVKHAKKLMTVSEFSKNQIAEVYNVDKNEISVVPNGWDHFKNIDEDKSILEKFPKLNGKEFYFTLGSLQKRKNLKWIAQYAKNHPDELFAVSGKIVSGMESNEINNLKTLPNVVLLGYVSDGEVKTLMKKCKAFIFPSYYEGFGIPPLEALSVGAQIVVSNASCLPEIYGKTAHYIDPNNPEVSLEEILAQPVSSPEKILEYYTYKNSAKKLYAILKDCNY